LRFGIWNLEFEIFFIWRFILPRPGKRLRLRKGDRRKEKGDRRQFCGNWFGYLGFEILNFEF